MKERYVVFEAGMDMGRNIMATAVARAIKKAHPDRKLIVITGHPEVWLHNPDIFRFYSPGRMNFFYDDFVDGKDTIIMKHDPLQTEDFAHSKKHLVEIWCDLCGVKSDGLNPSLFFTWREKEAVGKLVASNKPLFFIQTNIPNLAPNIPEFWATDIPLSVAQKVVDKMNIAGYITVHLRGDKQPVLANTTKLNMDSRQTLLAISNSDARLFIDSYSQHAAAAFGLDSVVVWIAGNPDVTGYKNNKNIKARAVGTFSDFINSYKEGYDIRGDMAGCPFDISKTLDADQVFGTLIKK